MTIKPEPQWSDAERELVAKARTRVPATPAPSAREWAVNNEQLCAAVVGLFHLFRNLNHRRPADSQIAEAVAPFLDAYARQQTAAKDAEIERLTAIAGDLTDRNDALTDESCKLQDDVASIVSTHRADWSWDDVLSDVRALKTNSGRVCSIVQALRDYYAKQPIFEPYVLQELGRVLAQLEAK